MKDRGFAAGIKSQLPRNIRSGCACKDAHPGGRDIDGQAIHLTAGAYLGA
jgi:hypothetical protein